MPDGEPRSRKKGKKETTVPNGATTTAELVISLLGVSIPTGEIIGNFDNPTALAEAVVTRAIEQIKTILSIKGNEDRNLTESDRDVFVKKSTGAKKESMNERMIATAFAGFLRAQLKKTLEVGPKFVSYNIYRRWALANNIEPVDESIFNSDENLRKRCTHMINQGMEKGAITIKDRVGIKVTRYRIGGITSSHMILVSTMNGTENGKIEEDPMNYWRLKPINHDRRHDR